MDDATLAGLEAALATSPGNLPLLEVLVKALVERQAFEAAAAHLADRDLGAAPGSLRLLAAEVFLATGKLDEALSLAAGQDGPEAILRARILLRRERRDEALVVYQAAVEANPALEDLELARELRAKARPAVLAGPGRPKLRVISNDDTDRSELDRLLQPASAPVTFRDVGGLDEVKRQIHRKIILPFQKPSIFQRFKKRAGGGILLYGPPGCGKTLMARATAGECGATFLSVAIADVLDMYIGESERKLAALFETARTKAPAVLFFDELEALGGRRQHTREATSSKLVSQFLAEMDGFSQTNQGLLVLGATNVPWAVDAAFRRPGRFDRVLFVPPPDRQAREAILALLLEERPLAGDVAVGPLAVATSGFSGADLRNLVETAADEAIEESLAAARELPIRQEHLAAALRQVKPTTHEWLTTARNYARYANEGGLYDDVLEFLERHGKA